MALITVITQSDNYRELLYGKFGILWKCIMTLAMIILRVATAVFSLE